MLGGFSWGGEEGGSGGGSSSTGSSGDSSRTRVGLVAYSSEVHSSFPLSSSRTAVATELRSLPYHAGWTKTHAGLDRAAQMLAAARAGAESKAKAEAEAETEAKSAGCFEAAVDFH